MTTNRPLRVFLCHSSADKPAVCELYQKLRAEPWIEPWLDEEELFPGMDWNLEIEKAIEVTDVILVCLSNNSITKEGYVQREIRIALDYADYKPEGTLFIIPIRLEECTPPKRLARWHYADYFEGQRERALQRLLVSLQKRAESLDINVEERLGQKNWAEIGSRLEELLERGQQIARPNNIDYRIIRNKLALSNGMEFMQVPAGKFLMGSNSDRDDEKPQHTVDIPYDYWMARYPIKNEYFNWYPKVSTSKKIADMLEGLDNDPVVNMRKWDEVVDYCLWLHVKFKDQIPSGLVLRLPTEAEWEKAARGVNGNIFPWGNKFDKSKCNTSESRLGNTTRIGFYSPIGDSQYGCSDMVGNVWEWTNSLMKKYPYNADDGRENINLHGDRVLRGGSFNLDQTYAHCSYRTNVVGLLDRSIGFRVCLAPPLPN